MELPFINQIRAATVAAERRKQKLTPGIAEAITKAANEGHYAVTLYAVAATTNDRDELRRNGYVAEWETTGPNEQTLKVIWK